MESALWLGVRVPGFIQNDRYRWDSFRTSGSASFISLRFSTEREFPMIKLCRFAEQTGNPKPGLFLEEENRVKGIPQMVGVSDLTSILESLDLLPALKN